MPAPPKPLVSCIMPTHNRRRFVSRAIRYFLRQEHEARELVVIDDGTDPVDDLCAVDARIRYIRLEEKWTVGAKRNKACELARGELIVHWDDDDWMADWRLRYQIDHLGGADICGLKRVLYFEPGAGAAWEYVFPGTLKPWVHGATLCFRKSFWEENRFADVNVGEDLRFVWNDPAAKIAALADNRFMAALIHPGNTSPKRTVDDCWFQLPLSRIQALIGKDWDFYRDPPAAVRGGEGRGPQPA